MARPPGSRNRDYELERERLAVALVPVLLHRDNVASSLRELATAAGVSVPTLRHYFGSREGAWRAAVEALGQLGATHIARTAEEERGGPAESTRWVLDGFVQAWTRFGVGTMFAAGLALGMASEEVGPAFVNALLEPTLQAAEARLSRHIARGELAPMDVRAAALALLSPVVLALLHQGALGGDRCRPLDLGALLDAHHAAWMRGWASPPAEAAR